MSLTTPDTPRKGHRVVARGEQGTPSVGPAGTHTGCSLTVVITKSLTVTPLLQPGGLRLLSPLGSMCVVWANGIQTIPNLILEGVCARGLFVSALDDMHEDMPRYDQRKECLTECIIGSWGALVPVSFL
jgi:hypothetical protein